MSRGVKVRAKYNYKLQNVDCKKVQNPIELKQCIANRIIAANFHTKLPLKYYNNLADMMYEKDCGSAVADSRCLLG